MVGEIMSDDDGTLQMGHGGPEQPLIEQVVGAWREQATDGHIQAHHVWHDLSGAERERAHQAAIAMRQLEAALDADGLSTTTRAVLARIQAAG